MKISALFTDLYELTMAQAYAAEGMEETAVFELAFRKMPSERNYIVAAGIDDVLNFLSEFRFADDDLDYLRRHGGFSRSFLARLRDLRFTGDVNAIPEGTLVFANEPIVQVIAPIMEAQLMETFVLNQVHFQSLATAKAARVVKAAAGRGVVDFGSRRAHGTDAALKAARALWLAGGAGTSNALASRHYGIPAFGTMAHSYIQAHDRESESFEAFQSIYPETTLLVDTYDTIEGVRRVIDLSRKLGDKFRVRAVRLDSGDLAELARESRRLLDEAGLNHVTIFVSGSLDEYEIQRLVASGAPIDMFGVGTRMAVLEGATHLDMAYKLVEYAGRGRLKLSASKVVCPGRKQVFRQVKNGHIERDIIGRWDERLPGEPLLRPFMRKGVRVETSDLHDARRRLEWSSAALPVHLRKLEPSSDPYEAAFSDRLNSDLQRIRRELIQVKAQA